MYGPANWIHTKGDTSDMAIVQPTGYPRTSSPGSTTCFCIPHAYVCWSPLSREQWRLVPSNLEKPYQGIEVALVGSMIRLASGLSCDLLY